MEKIKLTQEQIDFIAKSYCDNNGDLSKAFMSLISIENMFKIAGALLNLCLSDVGGADND